VPLLSRATCSVTMLLLFACLLGAPARAGADRSEGGPTPCVDKIDPPNWWIDMPGPMLLLHGRNLEEVQVQIKEAGVIVEKTQSSANGHWAFVWLHITGSGAQTLHMTVSHHGSSTQAEFQLRARKPETAAFQGFSSADVMYLIMTDRFADGDRSNDEGPAEAAKPRGWHGGDLRGIEQHLDYLQKLGVTTVWTTPVYRNIPSPQSYHGYSATDMYSVDPHYGTLGDYQHLSAAIHARGMKLVLDMVPNHVGPANLWVKDPPLPDWFHGTLARHDLAKGDFESLPDPHSSWQERRDITEGWFANVLPDLNQENPIVAQYLIQNAIWWVETAPLDGLRIDTFPYVNRAFWQKFHQQLFALYPHLTDVGEIFNGDPTITSYFAGGVAHDGIDTGLYTPFDFPIYFTLRQILVNGQPMTRLESILRQDELYPHPERLVTFLGNHDTARFLSEPGATLAELKMAFGLLATLRGMPQIYSGDEIAMEGGNDPDNRRNFPGGFPDGQPSAFHAETRTPAQRDMFDWVSGLLTLRAKHGALQSGQQQDVLDEDPTAFAFVRAADTSHGCDGQERLLIVVNNTAIPRTLHMATSDSALDSCTVAQPLYGETESADFDGTILTLTSPGKAFAVYSIR
jgi:glycosidase